jgi:prepilin-type N-terminal cleavage/methylation domain-containing protein
MSDRGFTLIEILVVASITGVLTTLMLINFQRTRLDLSLSTNDFIGQVRATQEKANGSVRFNDGGGAGLAIRCGYGLHYESNTSYSVYAGPNASIIDCTTENRNLGGNDFKILPIKILYDPKVEFKTPFNDIFFEPPNPTTFINNSSASASIIITIGKVGGTCPQDCKTINVSTSGTIE